MTEISNENYYYPKADSVKPKVGPKDEYHWVTPDTKTTGILNTPVPSGPTEVPGYDCTSNYG